MCEVEMKDPFVSISFNQSNPQTITPGTIPTSTIPTSTLPYNGHHQDADRDNVGTVEAIIRMRGLSFLYILARKCGLFGLHREHPSSGKYHCRCRYGCSQYGCGLV
jgi:hypothetical protein